MTVTIVRQTALRSAPSTAAPTIALVKPTSFDVTELQFKDGFLRVLLGQIDRRSPTGNQFGYVAAADVALGNPTTEGVGVRTRTDTVVRVRTDTVTLTRTDTVFRGSTQKATELIVRPDVPSPAPNAIDTPDLSFLKKGPLTAILQRPMPYQVGKTTDSIIVPAGFVTDFASIPRSLWTSLSPVGEYKLAAVVHDYLYWFQPCEREEADNLLMIAMMEEGVSDLQRGAVYAGVRMGGMDAWNANRVARDRGELKIVPTQVRPTALESWAEFRTRLGRADIRGTAGRMPRQKYCDRGKSQQVP